MVLVGQDLGCGRDHEVPHDFLAFFLGLRRRFDRHSYC